MLDQIVIEDLDPLRLRLRSLGPLDFDYANPAMNGPEDLQSVCDAIVERGAVLEYAGEMFDVMERLDEVDLGSPGPLVHVLESARPSYEAMLAESVERKPSPLTVWMVNRILNSERSDRTFWLGILGRAAKHPNASPETRREAESFLAHQVEPDPS